MLVCSQITTFKHLINLLTHKILTILRVRLALLNYNADAMSEETTRKAIENHVFWACIRIDLLLRMSKQAQQIL